MSAFVTGTDTGVGKTLVACALLRLQSARGLRTAGYKPVSAGVEHIDGQDRNEDVERLRAASSIALSPAEVCPFVLTRPLAPHIAAALDGSTLDLERMRFGYERLKQRADLVIVEGVGGFLVPLAETAEGPEDTGDLASSLALPVILVVGLRLGCLNHALLTAEAISRRGLRLAGWVGNRIDPAMARPQENIESLRRRLHAPCLGVVPWVEGADGLARERAAMQTLSDVKDIPPPAESLQSV